MTARQTIHMLYQAVFFSEKILRMSSTIILCGVLSAKIVNGFIFQWRKAALSCITACLQTFPGTMVTFRNKIEVVAMNELEGYSCSTVK